MKKIKILALLLIPAFSVQTAIALPPGDKTLHSSLYDVLFDIGAGSAEVDCEVYLYSSGVYDKKYIYTYRISNISSDAGLSFFSVCIPDSATAYDADFDPLIGAVDPALWTTIPEFSSGQVQCVQALFSHTIKNGFSSVWLWFVSDYASTTAEGVLCGINSDKHCYDTSEVLAPLPEPATLLPFTFGAMLTALTRKSTAA